jgi:hypothetical protein
MKPSQMPDCACAVSGAAVSFQPLKSPMTAIRFAFGAHTEK